MPQVVVVDEIGTEAEALACRTIAERGVQLIGTAHGCLLENLIKNPTLSDLVGGVAPVTLGDEEARLRGTQKTVSLGGAGGRGGTPFRNPRKIFRSAGARGLGRGDGGLRRYEGEAIERCKQAGARRLHVNMPYTCTARVCGVM